MKNWLSWPVSWFIFRRRESGDAMFNLTKDEQKVVAFLIGALLLGTAVKHWRATRPMEGTRAVIAEGQRN
jgi:hypothetical protein